LKSMSATVGEQRAASALRGALQEVQLVHGLLDEYDTTRDKKKLTEVSLKMKHILPTIKVQKSPPPSSCRSWVGQSEDPRTLHSSPIQFNTNGKIEKERLPGWVKELSTDPECKTKANAPLLIELSTGMKDAVARTKNFSTEASTTTTTRQPSPLSSSVSAASPLPTSTTTEPLSRHAASGWLNKLGDKGTTQTQPRVSCAVCRVPCAVCVSLVMCRVPSMSVFV
jgi:hypothetical protein